LVSNVINISVDEGIGSGVNAEVSYNFLEILGVGNAVDGSFTDGVVESVTNVGHEFTCSAGNSASVGVRSN